MDDEYLRRVSVHEPTPLDGMVELVDYRAEAERIRAVLGRRVLRIEHVGSTSVPGLAAKPVIDILLVIQDSADEKAYVAALEEAGYFLRIREPAFHEHRMFNGPNTDINLHIFSLGCPEVERMLLFRDRLRSDKADRELYQHTKRELARRQWKYVQNYADAKSSVVEGIISRARSAPPSR